jgi:hypothetical protein
VADVALPGVPSGLAVGFVSIALNHQDIGAALGAAGLAAPRIALQALTMEDVFIHRVLALEAAAQERAAT